MTHDAQRIQQEGRQIDLGKKEAGSEAECRKSTPCFTEEERIKFWSRVEIKADHECWIWKGPTFERGYGQTSVARRFTTKAHRMAYMIATNRFIPAGMFICHRCDNPPCVNPSHLFVGTVQDNANDMKKKRRGTIGEKSVRRTNPEKTARGERHGNAKLNENKVVEMRSEYAAGGTSFPKVARKYGIDTSTAYAIIKRKSWSHVP